MVLKRVSPGLAKPRHNSAALQRMNHLYDEKTKLIWRGVVQGPLPDEAEKMKRTSTNV